MPAERGEVDALSYDAFKRILMWTVGGFVVWMLALWIVASALMRRVAPGLLAALALAGCGPISKQPPPQFFRVTVQNDFPTDVDVTVTDVASVVTFSPTFLYSGGHITTVPNLALGPRVVLTAAPTSATGTVPSGAQMDFYLPLDGHGLPGLAYPPDVLLVAAGGWGAVLIRGTDYPDHASDFGIRVSP